jgi:general secretion pathway protein A
MITGAIGTGKTTLVHAALQLLSQKQMPIRSALLFNPTLQRDEFLEMMLEEFEVDCPSSSKPKRLAALQQMLLETQSRGGTSVLFIDEAHLLTIELLEEIRLLGNADTHHEKLLQIVLSGQPELTTIMNRPELNALQQRIASRAHLRPLGRVETGVYISERLHAAGLAGTSPFSERAVTAIFACAQGVPRLLNLVCDACLTLGFKTQRRTIEPDLVQEVAIALGLVPAEPEYDTKKLAAEREVGTSALPKTAVDVLIDAMKRKRGPAWSNP